MNGLTTLDFEESTVGVVEIDSTPWFGGRDVADRLSFADSTNAMKQHCRGVVKCHPIVDALGRHQEVRVLSEPDVLRLIVSSKLPAAERFERWVFEEVLPLVRCSGSYAPQADQHREALRMVGECRRTFGKAAAQRLWVELGLPAVSGLPTASLPFRWTRSRRSFGRPTGPSPAPSCTAGWTDEWTPGSSTA